MHPPRMTDPTNPFARRTPWGVARPAPFKLGLGPASMGGVKASGRPDSGRQPVEQAPKLAPPPPKMGSGILGDSPLIPKASRQACPAATPLGVPIGPSRPRSVKVGPAPSDAPPSDLDHVASRLREPPVPVGRRMLIVGVALGVIALIAVAAVMLSERNAQPSGATPVTAAVTPPDLAPPAAEAAAAEPVTEGAAPDAPPTAPIDRAETPAGTTPVAGAPRTTASSTTAQTATVTAPVLPPPVPVDLPPVAEALPPARPTPPPAYVRPPVDPDAPIVLRGEDR